MLYDDQKACIQVAGQPRLQRLNQMKMLQLLECHHSGSTGQCPLMLNPRYQDYAQASFEAVHDVLREQFHFE
jgi:hypothetical protein